MLTLLLIGFGVLLVGGVGVTTWLTLNRIDRLEQQLGDCKHYDGDADD